MPDPNLDDLVTKTGSPTMRRAGSPPSDGSNDGDNRGRMNDHGGIADDAREDEFDESPSRLVPLKFDDIKSITLRRTKLVRWFMEPFFEDLVSGCFVRIGIGKTKSGPKYRLCTVRNVDASDPDRQYKLGSYTTCKYLNAVWDNEANAARWQMTQVSDSPVLEEEFKEWLQDAEKNGVRIPTRQQVLEKKEAIEKQMLREKKSAVRRPMNVAAEKTGYARLEAGEAGYDPWQELYVSTNGKKREASSIDLEASGHSEAASRAVRPRERTNSKGDAQRDDSNLAFKDTIKKILAYEEARREKFQQKEEQMNNYLAIEEANAAARIKEAEAAMLVEETRIMTADLSLLDPERRSWFDARRKMIQDRDAPSQDRDAASPSS
ncbi:protein RTF1 homolog [Brachypodium distachyon]|uniref:Plus3 domain-containing protein n=1 Tax=Brachypodium distachyon TaxID=15368 RepID=I1IHW3_BRADI|nr:protein RTF1 homolog [Brachypodium distachyon]KQJ86485.1 hypothetical protein BRADI_4g05850v3 [Brachypodium distachyon]|eukprot:XP_010237206.1 protein RTF1 homolog [Brachypodium distachyon]